MSEIPLLTPYVRDSVPFGVPRRAMVVVAESGGGSATELPSPTWKLRE